MGQEARIILSCRFLAKGFNQGVDWSAFSSRGLTKEKASSKII